MQQRNLLGISLVATLCALALLLAIVAVALTASPQAGQEQFEVVWDAAGYSQRLAAVAGGLRIVLFLDGLFLLAYATAIGFAVLAFAHNNRAAAWFGGLGILAVMLLDAFENATMGQSADLIASGGSLTAERIAHQAAISAMKWQTTAAALLATSFVLPRDTLLEKTLVWGVRLGLPVAVPMFLYSPLGLRELGGLLLLISMLGGFVLLALVVRGRMRSA
jgi:hypothetical protein